MEIRLHKNFVKNYRKRIVHSKNLDSIYRRRVIIFNNNSANPILKDHKLSGNKKGFRSFSITGDIRVVYKINGSMVMFYDIGTHNQVY